MARKPRVPVNLPRNIGALSAFSPVTQQWIPAGIEDDQITTVCGPVSRRIAVRINDYEYLRLDRDLRIAVAVICTRHDRKRR